MCVCVYRHARGDSRREGNDPRIDFNDAPAVRISRVLVRVLVLSLRHLLVRDFQTMYLRVLYFFYNFFLFLCECVFVSGVLASKRS